MAEEELHRKETEPQEPKENQAARKRLFGRGVYGSKDVPIRLLDKLIAGAILLTVFLIVYATVNGGFHVRFDSAGGSAVEEQVLRYGEHVLEPEAPVKPGYVFSGWKAEDSESGWNFSLDTVSGSMKLVAQWTPAEITVRFDPAGGSLPETEAVKSVTYEGTYGELPVPERPGYVFSGWVYSGETVTAESTVQTNGEHVLTARWTKEADH